MSFIYTALFVPNIAALKALNSTSDPKRVDGVFLAVGDGLPAWYRYNAASTTTESLPSIVSPTDTLGRWFQFSGGSSSGSSEIIITDSSTSPYVIAATGTKLIMVRSNNFNITFPATPTPGYTVEIVADKGLGVIEAYPIYTINLNGKSYSKSGSNYSTIYVKNANGNYGGKLLYGVDGQWNDYQLNTNNFAIS